MYKIKVSKKNRNKLILVSDDLVFLNVKELKKRIARYLFELSINDSEDKFSQKIKKLNSKLKSYNFFELRHAYICVKESIPKNKLLSFKNSLKVCVEENNLKKDFIYDCYDSENYFNRILAKYHKKTELKTILALPTVQPNIQQYTPTINNNECENFEESNNFNLGKFNSKDNEIKLK